MGYDIDLFVSKESAQKFICAVCQNVAKDVCETKFSNEPHERNLMNKFCHLGFDTWL